MRHVTVQLEEKLFARLVEAAQSSLSEDVDPEVAAEIERLAERTRGRRANDSLAGVSERASSWGDLLPDADEEKLSHRSELDIVADLLARLAEEHVS